MTKEKTLSPGKADSSKSGPDPASGSEKESPFSMYYSQLSHQQNMLQDHVRTGTYERAMMENAVDFKDKVVLDVGTGTGILAYFAVCAGAKKVYAVEASAMAESARKLMAANNLSGRVEVLQGKIEELQPPEPVDVVISEPMGFLLVHERMLESYVGGRQRWMKPGGLMFPSVGTMFFSPFSDDALFSEQMSKVAFWRQSAFYGLDIRCLVDDSVRNHFSQPVVGYFQPAALLASKHVTHQFDFAKCAPEDLQDFQVPFAFDIERTAILHGIAGWFDVSFDGSQSKVVLSTGPHAPGTHWYQCRLLLPQPIAVNAGQSISGVLNFKANEHYSYDIEMEVRLDGTNVKSSNLVHLHDQMYHYLGNAASATPASY